MPNLLLKNKINNKPEYEEEINEHIYEIYCIDELTDDEKKQLIEECEFEVIDIPSIQSKDKILKTLTPKNLNNMVNEYLGGHIKINGKSGCFVSEFGNNKIEIFVDSDITDIKEPDGVYDTAEEFMNDWYDEMVNSKYRIEDIQGGNLGNIEADRFSTLDEIIDRMDIYWNDYGIAFVDNKGNLL